MSGPVLEPIALAPAVARYPPGRGLALLFADEGEQLFTDTQQAVTDSLRSFDVEVLVFGGRHILEDTKTALREFKFCGGGGGGAVLTGAPGRCERARRAPRRPLRKRQQRRLRYLVGPDEELLLRLASPRLCVRARRPQ